MGHKLLESLSCGSPRGCSQFLEPPILLAQGVLSSMNSSANFHHSKALHPNPTPSTLTLDPSPTPKNPKPKLVVQPAVGGLSPELATETAWAEEVLYGLQGIRD